MTTPNTDPTQTDDKKTVSYADHQAAIVERDNMRTQLAESQASLSGEQTKFAASAVELKKLQTANEQLATASTESEALKTENATLKEKNTAHETRYAEQLTAGLKAKGVTDETLKDKTNEQLQLMTDTLAGIETPAGKTPPNPQESGLEGGNGTQTPAPKTALDQANLEVAKYWPSTS